MPNRDHGKQFCGRGSRLCVAVTLVLLTLSSAACGKKPNQIDPPPGIEKDTFPRTYPDPATDLAP
jgi:hypothetical protein